MSYEELWKKILRMSGLSQEERPDDEELIKDMISDAVESFNINKATSMDLIKCDNDSEEVFLDKNDKDYFTKIKILALYVKLNICTNNLEYMQNMYQYNLREIEPKFYKDQVSSRTATINSIKKEIGQLFNNFRNWDYDY